MKEDKKHYHAIAFFSDDEHYWINMSREALIKRVVIPYSNGHIVKSSYGEINALINFKATERLLLFETPFELKKEENLEIDWDQVFDHPDLKNFDCTDSVIKDAIEFTKRSGTSLFQKRYYQHKDQVFVIMQFGNNHLDSAYEGVVKQVFKKHGISVLRSDEIQNSGKISEQILENIAASRIVLADLTGGRPNCYYETGFAHAIGKDIILTIRKGESIHFDLADHRFIIWETETELRNQLKIRVAAMLKTGEEGKTTHKRID